MNSRTDAADAAGSGAASRAPARSASAAAPDVATPAEPTIEFVTSADGTEIALHHFGGEGPPLVICHATGFHAYCYSPMLPTFTERFDVWAIDFRGHGRSRLPADTDLTWADYAADLESVVATLVARSGEPVRAFGHSMGGASILRVAATRPELFAKAWVFEPIIVPDEVEAAFQASADRGSMMADNAARRRAEFPSRAEAMARYASRPPFSHVRADALLAYVTHGFRDTGHGTVTLACDPRHEALTFAGAKTVLSQVARIEVSTVVARGRLLPDQPGAADFSDPLAAALPNGTLEIHDQLSHLGPFEAPDLIANAALTSFSMAKSVA